MKTISILGAGIGGIATAHLLQKRIKKSIPYKILLIEKESHSVFAPSLPWLMIGKRKENEIKKPVAKLSRNKVEVIKGIVDSFSPEELTFSVNAEEIKSDYIIIALGAETNYTPQLEEVGYNFFDINQANLLYEDLKSFNGGKIAIVISSLPFKCPASPYEAAMLIEYFIRERGIRDKTEIAIYTPEMTPLPVAGKAVGEAVKSILEMKKIKYFTNHQIDTATGNTLRFTNGNSAQCDLLTFTPRHTCPSVISKTSLVNSSGWVEVNKNNLETKFKNVFAIGDITSIPLEMGKPLPKAGVFAHYQAEVVAHNISEKINGGNNFKSFDGSGECFVELGDYKAGYAKGNFYASPTPNVEIKKPGYRWHLGKVWFEKYWWLKYFKGI